jgi:hypothetical protein
MSAVPPAGVSGTVTAGGALIRSPETKTQRVPSGQGAQPLERIRHTFWKDSPAESVVSSGTVTSATKVASGRQGVGLGVPVGADVGREVGVFAGADVDVAARVGTGLSVGRGVPVGVAV